MAHYQDARIKSGYASNTVRLELAVLSHLFETARKEWGMGRTFQSGQVDPDAFPSGRTGPETQNGGVGKTSRKHFRRNVSDHPFALETGMRRSEIAGMTWESVDLKKRVVTLSETKNGTKRIVPLDTLSQESIRILSGIPRRIDGKVWWVAPDTISQDFA